MKSLVVCILAAATSVAARASMEKSGDFGGRRRAFFEQVEKLDEANFKKDIFQSGKVAIKALDLAGEYPEYPDSNVTALNQILESEETQVPGQLLSEEIHGCRPAQYYGFMKRLMNSSSRYRFSSEQKHKLSSLLIRHLDRDAQSVRPLFNQRLNLQMIQLAKGKGLLKLTADQESRIESSLVSLRDDEPDREAKRELLQSESGTPDFETARESGLRQIIRDELQKSEALRADMKRALGADSD